MIATRLRRSGYLVTFALFALVSCNRTSILGVIPIPGEGDPTGSIAEILLGDESFDGNSLATVSLDNTGREAVAITRIVYSTPEAFSIYSEELPGSIAPGELAQIDISFHPAAPGSYRSVVEVYLEGRELPVTFTLSGTR